jgi:undecaprenyl diphosphate synthase
MHACVKTLTLYAFSAANWGRPAAEVDALLCLVRRYLLAEGRHCVEQSIRINVVGRRDRLSEPLLRAIDRAERLTASGQRMHLRIVVDYSSHYSIVRAAWRANRDSEPTPTAFNQLLHQVDHSVLPTAAIDLLIRTGGERRLSDFMLWEIAFAELYFTDCLWPDFDERAFQRALDDYASRTRSFGRLASERF